jgi:hypothetical protein
MAVTSHNSAIIAPIYVIPLLINTDEVFGTHRVTSLETAMRVWRAAASLVRRLDVSHCNRGRLTH